MILYRCALKKWAKDLTGQGAFLYGGRWNSPGKNIVYTAENNLLAALEVALRVPLTNISSDYVMIPIFTPDNAAIYSPTLPKNWNRNPKLTQQIGNEFLEENKFLLMKVPSALMSNTFNFLINPKHKLFKEVKVNKPESLLFDERLIKMMQKENE
ncbi:MAG TPA: RES family NAD+ phosphorylase [Cyclobacteriaceae bacterium]|nr:RES family NAD+ phosphorylase [Cyclobacteriaceae bacterium]